ncbi:hypothetical protein PSCLAVI8L_480003 [Pseudoclavibacter sp. 8L]|nr:hypothetical protein PSCLAVI8L_480003 [Pseudoclavibacter sp. 8L]
MSAGSLPVGAGVAGVLLLAGVTRAAKSLSAEDGALSFADSLAWAFGGVPGDAMLARLLPLSDRKMMG